MPLPARLAPAPPPFDLAPHVPGLRLRDVVGPVRPMSPAVVAREADVAATIAGLYGAGQWLMAKRLEGCRARRERWRRGLRDDEHPACGLPLCAFCRQTLGRAEGRRAAEFLQRHGGTNQTSYWLSVDLARVADLDDVKLLLGRFAARFREMRQNERRNDPRWADVCALIYAEVEYAPAPEVLPPRRRAVVEALPAVGEAAVWAMHTHAIVVQAGRPGQPTPTPIGAADVKAAVRGLYPDGPDARVHAKPLHLHRAAKDNAITLGGYGSKLRLSTKHRGSGRVPWPIERRIEYLLWLTSHRRALQPLRALVKPENGRAPVPPPLQGMYEQAENAGGPPRRRGAEAVRKRNETRELDPLLTGRPGAVAAEGGTTPGATAAEVPPAPPTPAGAAPVPAEVPPVRRRRRTAADVQAEARARAMCQPVPVESESVRRIREQGHAEIVRMGEEARHHAERMNELIRRRFADALAATPAAGIPPTPDPDTAGFADPDDDDETVEARRAHLARRRVRETRLARERAEARAEWPDRW